MGVVSAGLTFAGVDLFICDGSWMSSTGGQLLSLAAYIALIVFLYHACKKARKD